MTIVFLLNSMAFACDGGDESDVSDEAVRDTEEAGDEENKDDSNDEVNSGEDSDVDDEVKGGDEDDSKEPETEVVKDCDPACGANSSCVQKGGVAMCVCDDGYVGDGSTCTSEDSCADASYWDITYTLPKSDEKPGNTDANLPVNQNVLTLRGTMMGMGDGNRNIGPGTATVRFENIDGQPGGKAYLLSFEMPMDFTVRPATSNIVGSTGHDYDEGPCGSSAVGNVEGDKIVWSDFDGKAQGTKDASNVRGYFTDGTITCDGSLCGSFGAPPARHNPAVRGPL